MLYDVIGYSNQVIGQVDAIDQLHAWEKAGKNFKNILDVRPATQLPRWTETHYWPFHGVMLDYNNDVLDEDDFNYPPSRDLIRAWADLVSKRTLGEEEGGIMKKTTVRKVVITGPEGYSKTWSIHDLF